MPSQYDSDDYAESRFFGALEILGVPVVNCSLIGYENVEVGTPLPYVTRTFNFLGHDPEGDAYLEYLDSLEKR